MAANDNVINLDVRRKAKTSREARANGQSTNEGNAATVVDLSERRQEILQEERRQVRRTILTEFIGAFAVVPQRGLCEVALYDISEHGLAFDLDFEKGRFDEGEEIAMRIYMNQHTYFPFTATISNIREINDEGVFRHGTEFVKGTINDQALHHFIKFIENVSSCLERDNGDIMVSSLGKNV